MLASPSSPRGGGVHGDDERGTSIGHSNVDDGVLVSMLYGSIETIEELDITGCTHLGIGETSCGIACRFS